MVDTVIRPRGAELDLARGVVLVFGLLLLGGAFAWQRVRPRAIPDLRAMPEGLR
jgi:hypothetical protein